MKSMALSRSPSPVQSRSASPLKKSVNRSPYITKLFSPLDSCKKNSGSKHFTSEKENEQDPASSSKPTKERSPAMMTSSPKGAQFQKNFMAPTISASSKAVGPTCQRKQVLGERNEKVVKSSSVGPAVRSLLASTQVGDMVEGYTDRTSPSAEAETETETETETYQSPSRAVPPYDPRVNYLSPRPQFLYYKPKPPAELFRNEIDLFDTDLDAGSLEEDNSLSSEGSDEVSEEDNLSEETASPQIEFPQIKLQPSRVTAMHSKLSFAPLLLVLLIGCMCIPLSDTPMAASFPNQRYDGFCNGLREISSRLSHWWVEGFSYPFAKEASFPKEIITFSLANLTCMVNEMKVPSKEVEITAIFERVNRENEVSEMQTRYEIGNIENGEEEEEEERQIEINDANSTSDPQPKKVEKPEPEILNNPQPELTENHEIKDPEPIMVENAEPKLTEPESEPEILKNPQPELTENHEITDSKPIMIENAKPKLIEPESEPEILNNPQPELTENHEIKDSEPKLTESESSNMSDQELIKISKKSAQGIAAVAFSLSLVVALGFAKKKRNRVLVSGSTNGDKTRGMIWGSSDESHIENRMLSLHHQNSTVDMMEEEFSSSSFEVGTGVGTGTGTPREVKTRRRESEASSGSYGSFVSYEKLSSKKGNMEGEEMTPVRRSSRLRSKETN